YGDIVSYRMGGEQMFFINDPQYIRDILVTHNKSFMKGRGLQRAKRILGEGLLTSEGAIHLRQRRLMQPAFHRDAVAGYGAAMDTFWMMMLPFADAIERLPVPKLRRARMSRVRLDQIIYRMIADRRASGRDHGDLLSMLL